MQPRTLAILLLLMLPAAMPWLVGCSALPARLPTTAEDNTARLLQHPQFQEAARAAPDFVKDCLATITRLETEKANLP